MAGIFLVLLKASFFTSGSVTIAVSMQKTWRIDFPRFSPGNAGFKQREADNKKEVSPCMWKCLVCVSWNILWKVFLFHLHKWLTKNWILSWDQWRDWTLLQSNAFYRMQFPWCTECGLSPKAQSWIFLYLNLNLPLLAFLLRLATCWCSTPKPRSLNVWKTSPFFLHEKKNAFSTRQNQYWFVLQVRSCFVSG